MTRRTARILVTATMALGVALLIVVGINSTRWIGTCFPSFFVLPNRVIPSVALPDWLSVPTAELFQQQVVAVDGRPIASAQDVYARAAAAQPGVSVTYELRHADGSTATIRMT